MSQLRFSFLFLLFVSFHAYSFNQHELSSTQAESICKLALRNVRLDRASFSDFSKQRQKAASAVAEAHAEVAKPEVERKRKDPRFLSFLRGADNNPVTIELKAEIAENQKVLDSIKAIEELREVKIKVEAKGKTDSGNYEEAVATWLAEEADLVSNELHRELSQKEPDLDAIEDITSRIKEVSDHISKFTDPQKASKEDFTRRLFADVTTMHVHQVIDLTQKHMAREVDGDIAASIANESFRTGKSLEEVVKLFAELDKIAGSKKGIDDSDLIPVLHLALTNKNKTSKELVSMYKEIRKLGAARVKEFHIDENSIPLLLETAIAHNKKPKDVVDRFYEIKSFEESRDSEFYFTDASMSLMTKLSFDHPGETAKTITDRFFEIYNKGKKHDKPDDLSVALLMESSMHLKMTTEDTMKKYNAIKKSVEKLMDPDTSEVAHFTDMAIRLNVDTKRMTTALARVFFNHHETVAQPSTQRALTIIALTVQKHGKSFTDEQLDKVAATPIITLLKGSDHLINDSSSESVGSESDSVVKKVTSPSSLSTRSASYAAASSDRGSKRDSDSGFGLTWGTEGLQPHVGLGSGLGIDLTDGSLTIGLGGGMKLDTDGSGIKFGF